VTSQSDDRPHDDNGSHRPISREVAQIELILREFEGAAEVDPPDWRETGARYVYRAGWVLVRDRDLPRLQRLLRDDRPSRPGRQVNGLTPYELPAAFDFPDPPPDFRRDYPLTLQYLQYFDWHFGAKAITPDHLHYVVDVSPCPATEPEVVPTWAEPDPGVSTDRCDGYGVKVVVVDIGWTPAPRARWLNGVDGELENPFDPAGNIRPYAGHGTFIAGVVRCIAPAAEVYVKGVFTRAGATWESDLVPKLFEALDGGADIISLSAGTRTRGDLPSLGFEVFFEEVVNGVKGLALVAAAGNDGDRAPFYPAASTGTVSVGALDARRRARASFSNYGGWVDTYAPGTDLVNAYLDGRFICHEPPDAGQQRLFEGMASWSGTSFATPVVAGLIAARMSETGENARQAADSLLRYARSQTIPGVGAVLLPGQACADSAGTCGCHHCRRCPHDC
jgi:hypothetical protein